MSGNTRLVGVLGIGSDAVNTALKLLAVVLIVFWLAVVYWTFADARRRIADPMIVGCCALASLLFPFVGTVVYMIVRPPEYLDDVRERELEMQAAEARLQESGHLVCPHCELHVEKDFLRCPHCMRRLKEPCVSCGRPLDAGWAICPYCGSEVADHAPATLREPPGVAQRGRTGRTAASPETSAVVDGTA
jgi:RNA polymerase subunit RPABC4/transcription elongation factor Spt4